MKGIKLRKIRKESKLSQNEFGKKLGVTGKTIREWEKAEEISPKALRLVDDFLHERNINISISENKAGGDQNFFNDHTETKGNKNIEEINRLRNEIEILTIENKKLTKQLIECKNQLIECLTKK